MVQDLGDNSLLLRIRQDLPRLLPGYLAHQRWYGGKARVIHSAEVWDILTISCGHQPAFIILVNLNYSEGGSDLYALPLVPQDRADAQGREGAISALRLQPRGDSEEVVLNNAFLEMDFSNALIELIQNGATVSGTLGDLIAVPTKALRSSENNENLPLEPSLMKAEQSNTSVRYGDRFILKFFRRLEEGINPDLEIGAFLTEKAAFGHVPAMCGTLEYRRDNAPAIAMGILQSFVPNMGDAWRHTLGELKRFFENVSSPSDKGPESAGERLELTGLLHSEYPSIAAQLVGDYWDLAALLGRRTAQLHLALASDSQDPDFCPEKLSSSFLNAQSKAMHNLVSKVFQSLKKPAAALPTSIRDQAAKALARESEILQRLEAFATREIACDLIRIHGDYHLGQVLFTGTDFVIIDFEGEPARSLEERRKKRCAIQDVAGMLRSFHYAAYTGLANRISTAGGRNEDLEPWAGFWHRWISTRFIKEYLSAAGSGRFIPQPEKEFVGLLEAYLLEKAVYELGYELNNRPDWVYLPLQGILQLTGSPA